MDDKLTPKEEEDIRRRVKADAKQLVLMDKAKTAQREELKIMSCKTAHAKFEEGKFYENRSECPAACGGDE